MTPYEAWMKRIPQVNHLCAFGCDTYAHIPKDERQKLDVKTKKCIFLGYGQETKGYRLHDPNMCKVLHCCDVKFYEYEREADPEADNNSEPVYHLVLDFSDDCEALSTDKLVE